MSLEFYFLVSVNLRKPEIVVNSSGSNNEIIDISVKRPDADDSGGGGGGNNIGTHEKTDDEIDIIGTLIGEYGKWQFIMTLLLALFQVPNTFHIYSPTFQVSLSLFRHLFDSGGLLKAIKCLSA